MGKKRPSRSRKLHCFKYIFFFCIESFCLECLFNATGAEVNIDRLLTIASLSIDIIGVLHIQQKTTSIQNALLSAEKKITKTLKNYHITLSGHFICAFLLGCIKYIQPLFNNGIKGAFLLILILASPVFSLNHGCAKAVKLGQDAYHTAFIWLKVDEAPSASNTEDQETDSQVPAENSEEEDRDASRTHYKEIAREVDEQNLYKKNINTDEMNFSLNTSISRYQIDTVINHILYDNIAYSSDSETLSALYSAIFTDISSGQKAEPDYMKIFFPNAEQISSESEINEMEKKFLSDINEENTEPPSSHRLDEVISSRKGAVRQLKSYQMAKALANNYLFYFQEYIYQKNTDDALLYYSGMAIIAGKLQLHYARNDSEREAAFDWILFRYRELADMELLKGSKNERVNQIVGCLMDMQNKGELW